MYHIHNLPDGRFLDASNRGQENNLALFSINEDGRLKNIAYQSTFGKHPRIFAIDEKGEFLIVTNVKSGNAIVFKRNKETGLFKKISEIRGLKNVFCADQTLLLDTVFFYINFIKSMKDVDFNLEIHIKN